MSPPVSRVVCPGRFDDIDTIEVVPARASDRRCARPRRSITRPLKEWPGGRYARRVSAPPSRGPRLRELGLHIGRFDAGSANAITDVSGVTVGHVTVWRDEPEPPAGRGVARTGVTAVAARPGRDAARRAGAGRHGGPERRGRAHRIDADRRLGLHRDARVPHVHARGGPRLRRRRSPGRGRRAARRDGGLRHPRRRRVRRQLALGGPDRAGRGRRRRPCGRRRRRRTPSPRAPSAAGPG